MKISKIYEGNLVIKKGEKRDFSKLEKVTGSLYINSNAKLEALQSVGGSLHINSESKLEAQNLQSIGGYLEINSEAKLEALQSIGGYLYINSNAKLEALQSVGGSLYINSNAKLEAQNLQSIGGYLEINSESKLEAQNLQSIGGYLYINSNAKLEAPMAKFNVKGVRELVLKFNFECFIKAGYLFADGILAKILEKKKNVYKIQICGQLKTSFCIEVDGQFSHGETIKQAKEDLKYKISNRDKSQYESWTLDKKITLEQAIKMYRVIAGACELGTKHFVENVLTVKKKYYTVKEVIELTKRQYNNEVLAKFFEVNK